MTGHGETLEEAREIFFLSFVVIEEIIQWDVLKDDDRGKAEVVLLFLKALLPED